jgi:hypothetical protein
LFLYPKEKLKRSFAVNRNVNFVGNVNRIVHKMPFWWTNVLEFIIVTAVIIVVAVLRLVLLPLWNLIKNDKTIKYFVLSVV